jgi:uncharacterized protein YprB with RNaseH-like and TPR domain
MIGLYIIQMKRVYINRVIVAIIFIFFITFLIIIKHNIFIVFKVEPNEKYYGVIDGDLSKRYDNVILNEKATYNANHRTHGDNIIEFINKASTKINLYYYDAESNGTISSDEIIKGLNWMLVNHIKKVNLSLSSKNYSVELENWIYNNRKEITVYCSYNNKINTLDYPAMYENVIASGHNNITYKECDIKYRSNRIIVLPQIKTYEGTTFLSVITMLKN